MHSPPTASGVGWGCMKEKWCRGDRRRLWRYLLQGTVCVGTIVHTSPLLYSRPPPPPHTHTHAHAQVQLGGWDQSQYGYWATNGNLSIARQFNSYVNRAQNDFIAIAAARMKEAVAKQVGA